MKRVNEIFDRVIEADLHKFWDLQMNWHKIYSHKIAIVHPLDGYYSFNLYHIQPAFYLLLIGWCLSAFCFMVEVFYFRLISKSNWRYNVLSATYIWLSWMLHRTTSSTRRQRIHLPAVNQWICHAFKASVLKPSIPF